MIKKEFTEVVLLNGDGNLWWTGAINLGVKYVLENAAQADYILTLNDDTIIKQNYLETLLVCASKNQRSLIGSIAIKNDDRMTIEDGGVKINWSTAKFNFLVRGIKYKIIVNKEPSVIPVDVLSGRGTLIPVATFHDIGLYDFSQLPHYGADYEFSHRAKKKGYNLFINYKSAVVNKVVSTINDNEYQSFKWNGFLKKLFSKGSPFCIRYRWNFARLTCPKLLLPSFFLFDMVRIIIGALRSKIIYKSIKYR
jgi:GT2 family glycosyltransferase